MRLRPVVALLDSEMIADVLAALDLWRTHPLPIHTTRKMFPVKDGTRRLYLNAPDARVDAIIGTSIGGILRRSFAQLDGQTGLQVQWEVGVFVQVPLALFRLGQGTHP